MPDNDRIVPTPASSDLPTYTILLGGQAISSAYQVLSVSVSRNMNRIGEAEIIFIDGDVATETFAISDTDDFKPGAQVEIKAGYHQNEATIFKGVVVKHAVKIIQNSTSVLVITLKHEAFRMTLGRKNRIFPDKTDSDAISDILDEHSLNNSVETTSAQQEHLLQNNASDWDFVVMRAEANGLYVVNEIEKVSVKKFDTSAQEKLSLYYGSSILEFEAEMDARTSFSDISVSSWHAADQQMKEETGSSSLDEEGNLTTDTVGSDSSIPALKLSSAGYLDDNELTGWANDLAQKKQLSKIRGRASCIGFADVGPGDMLSLNGVGARFNGKAFVSGIHHSITAGNWTTSIQFGIDFKAHADHFTDIAAKPAAGLLPPVSGLQIGVVAQLKDDPKGEDRILVKIPAMSADDSAVWARVATLDAGKERGSFFRPEIGDEVILGFLNDDPRNAIVLGMLNSSKLPAPIQATDENHQKGFVTREKMKLMFDDDKKIINIETPKGNKIVISEDAKGITITDENNNKWQMDDNGIAIESAKDFTVKATGDIKMEGINVEIKASANLKAEGSAGASVKSSAITEVKGSMVNIN